MAFARDTGTRSPAVITEPAAPRPTDNVVVAWRVPEGMDNDLDAYHVSFSGPGGSDCSRTVRYGGGASWNLRYNKRYLHERGRIGFPPRREAEPPPFKNATWCVGTYSGKVVFTDYPAGRRHRVRHTGRFCSQEQIDSGNCRPTNRLVGRFSFAVR